METWNNNTNSDCENCCRKTMIDDGGGDYEDIQPYCSICKRTLQYVKADNKPCKLKKGDWFEAKSHNAI